MSYPCPICHKRFEPSEDVTCGRPKYYPFCSSRCKMIDLGAWLDADYKVVSKVESDAPEISEDGF
ncbi:MAG: DNA gyrase inhibitor YacG [Planctomycetes bacterium]|nr:DNA gyrase inhibitor YacG [Planctomycetota bacterium]